MREIIRIAALTGALLVSGAAAAQEALCVPLDLAAERLEAGGFELLATDRARFTENDLIYFVGGGVVLVVVSVDGCVIPTSLALGSYKPEYGI